MGTDESLPPNARALSDIEWRPGAAPGELANDYRWRVIKLDVFPLVRLGAHLEELPPGACSCPLHYHCEEEEAFYVIEGELTVRELRLDEEEYTEYTVRSGDAIHYAPGTGLAHQFFNRSSTPTRFLAFSAICEGDICVYPDSGKVLIEGAMAVGVWCPPDDTSAAQAIENTVQAARARGARRVDVPEHVVRASAGRGRALHDRASNGTRQRRVLETTASTVDSLYVHEDDEGTSRDVLHSRIYGEELLMVLQGRPVLREVRDGVESRFELAPGTLVHFPPGDGAARAIIHQQAAVCLYLGVSPRHEIIRFPERDEWSVRRFGGTGRVARADYWDGVRRPNDGSGS